MKNRTAWLLLSVLACIFSITACGGGSSSGGGGGANSSSGGSSTPQTFSVEVNAITISRLDNDEAVATEGAIQQGATVTLD